MQTVIMVIVLLILVAFLIFLGTALFGAPYVPSREAEIMEGFAHLHPLTKNDVVVDFGCGDGVVLRAAIRSGSGKAIGLELNPILAATARLKSYRERKIKIKCGDMRLVRLPKDMTIAYVFGLDRVMKMIKPQLERFARENKRDIYVLSYAFEFSDIKPIKRYGGYYLYIIKKPQK